MYVCRILLFVLLKDIGKEILVRTHKICFDAKLSQVTSTVITLFGIMSVFSKRKMFLKIVLSACKRLIFKLKEI